MMMMAMEKTKMKENVDLIKTQENQMNDTISCLSPTVANEKLDETEWNFSSLLSHS